MVRALVPRFPRLAAQQLLLLLLVCTSPRAVLAVPRYAAAYGQECGLCHVDPTGGGLRSTYASQFLVPTELAWRGDRPELLDAIDPELGRHIVVGADLRVLFDEVEGPASTLLTMQSDVHVAIAMDASTSIVMDLGGGRRSEAFGLARVLPWEGWLKAGRFVPAYGWRFADHQLYTRRHALSTVGEDSPVVWEDSGVEAGVAPGRLQLTASVQAGAGAVGESFTVRMVVRQSLGVWNLSAGASALRRQSTGGHRRVAGGFASLGVGRLTWMGQADQAYSIVRHRERILTQELALRVARGWSLLLTHEFHDPDRDLESGSRQRVSLGLDVLLTPFVGVTALARAEDIDPGPAVQGTDRLRSDLVVHFLF